MIPKTATRRETTQRATKTDSEQSLSLGVGGWTRLDSVTGRLLRRLELALRVAERRVDWPFDSEASLRLDRRLAALEAVREEGGAS